MPEITCSIKVMVLKKFKLKSSYFLYYNIYISNVNWTFQLNQVVCQWIDKIQLKWIVLKEYIWIFAYKSLQMSKSYMWMLFPHRARIEEMQQRHLEDYRPRPHPPPPAGKTPHSVCINDNMHFLSFVFNIIVVSFIDYMANATVMSYSILY